MSKDSLGVGAPNSSRNGAGDPLGVNTQIARKLKEYYDGLVTPDIPDRFAELMKQLDQAEPQQSKKD